MKRRIPTVEFAIVVMLFITTVALFARGAGYGFVNIDDPQYITQNPYLNLGLSWRGIQWAITTSYPPYWHPLTWIVYLAITSVFGVRAEPLHIFNIVLHASTACLLFIFLTRTSGARWCAAIAAAFFAFHPLRVESVIWIAETKDVLAGFLFVLTLLFYRRYVLAPSWIRYGIVTFTYILALASKPTVVTLPLVLLLLDYWPLARRNWIHAVIEKIPWVVCAGIVSVLAYRLQLLNGALNLSDVISRSARWENAAVSTVHYISQNFWPARLAIFYPHSAMLGKIIPKLQWESCVALIIVLSLIAWLLRRSAPYIFVGWAWFLGTLVPMIGIVQAGEQAMADRHSLIPSIGLIVGFVWLVAALVRPPRVGIVLGLFAAAALWVASWNQIAFWRNTETLFTRANVVTENNYFARNALAAAYFSEGKKPREALALARSAVKICPLVPAPHHTLAMIEQAQGMPHEAFAEYEASLRLDPYSSEIHDDFGTLLVEMGRDTDAMKQFRRAIALKGTNARARHNLAICLANHGQPDEAISQWRIAVQTDPTNGVMQGWLAEALRVRGDTAEAVIHYRAALADGIHNPDWESKLAWLIASNPNSSPDELLVAVQIATDAVHQTKSSEPGPLNALSASLARVGRVDDAITTAQTAATLADAQHLPSLAKAIRGQIEGYRQGRIFSSRSRLAEPGR